MVDRRGEPRIEQAHRTVFAEFEGRTYPFLLRNISSRGVAGRCDAPLAVGCGLTFIFEGWRRVAGRVRWNRQGVIGIEFVGRLSLDLLSPAPRNRVERQPRYRVTRKVTIAVGAMEDEAVIRNISTTGALIESRLRLDPAQRITLRRQAGQELTGRVRWVSPGRAGLQFDAPISLEDFGHE